MASISGLQNNALIVNTIDGLTNLYATSIYDNGTLITPGSYVPYSGATSDTNLNNKNLTNVNNLSSTTASIPIITTNTIQKTTAGDLLIENSAGNNIALNTTGATSGIYLESGSAGTNFTNSGASIGYASITPSGTSGVLNMNGSASQVIVAGTGSTALSVPNGTSSLATIVSSNSITATSPSVSLINYIQWISSTQLLVRLSVPDLFSVGDVLNIEDNFYRGQVVYQSTLGPGTNAFYVSNGGGYGNNGNKFGGSISLNKGIINSNIIRNKQNIIDNLYTFKKDSTNSNLQLFYVNDSSLFYWTPSGRFKSLENECKTVYAESCQLTGGVSYIQSVNTWSTYQTTGNNFNIDFNTVNKVFVDTAGKLGATSLSFTSNLITNTTTLSSFEVSQLTGITSNIQAQINALSGSGFLTKTGTNTGCSPTLQLNTNTSTFLINGYLGVLYPLFCVNFTTAGDTFIKNIHSTSQINSKSASYYDISSSIQGLLDTKINANGLSVIQIPVLRFTASSNYFQIQDEKSNELVSFTKTYNTFTQESYFNSGLSGQYSQMRFGFGTSGKSFMIRYDGGDFYILISDTYNGIFNSLRPFFINATSGKLNSQNGQEFSGGLNSTSNIICSKSNASVRVQSGSYGCDFATNTTAGFFLADASVNDTCVVSNLSPIRLSGGSSLTTDIYIDNTLVTIKNRVDVPIVNCNTQLWVPSNGSSSIYFTDLNSNVTTPSTTFSRYFATGGNVYQDFYNTFNWRSSPTLNASNVHTSMTLVNRSTTKGDLTVNGNITCDSIKVLSGAISTQINPYLLSRTEASNFMEYGETMSCVIFDRVAWTTGSTYISWFKKACNNSTLSFVGNVTAYSSSAGQNIYWRITFDNLTDGSSYVHEYSFYFNQAFVHTTLPCVGVVSSSGNSGFGTNCTAGVYTVTFVRLNTYMASDAGDSVNIHFLITPNFRGK
jgi:hypothetical protein